MGGDLWYSRPTDREIGFIEKEQQMIYTRVPELDFIEHASVVVFDKDGPLFTVPVPKGEVDPMIVARAKAECAGLGIIHAGEDSLVVAR